MGLSGQELTAAQREPKYAEGLAKLEEALALYREIGDKAGEGNILWALGQLQLLHARPARPPSTGIASPSQLHREAGHRTMEAWSLHMLALVQIGHGEIVESASHAREALAIFRDAGDVGGITLILDDLASIAVAAGDPPTSGPAVRRRAPPAGHQRHGAGELRRRDVRRSSTPRRRGRC